MLIRPGTIAYARRPSRPTVIASVMAAEPHANGPEPSAPESTDYRPPQRVLIVEDLPDTRESLQTLIKIGLKLDVDAAEDGGKALVMLGERAYSLVITDLRMPRIDGMKLIREIQ